MTKQKLDKLVQKISVVAESPAIPPVERGLLAAILVDVIALYPSSDEPTASTTCHLCSQSADEVAKNGCFYQYDKEQGCMQAIRGACALNQRAEPTADARDAARYRWLREHGMTDEVSDETECYGVRWLKLCAELDNAIDLQMNRGAES